MRHESLASLVCPKCLGNLVLGHEILDGEEIVRGNLHCKKCNLNFPIVDGVAIFGIRKRNLAERLVESGSEGLWASEVVSMDTHANYARGSSWKGELAIKKISAVMESKKRINKSNVRVLDIGAGMGFQSWQFAKHGFKSFAVELSSEFLFAGGSLIDDENHFERVIADCSVLPFKRAFFDIIFCKEIIHHIGEFSDLLSEISRVASPNALIYISEPCSSILLNEKMSRKLDHAAHIGIDHHYYNVNQYIAMLNKIAPKINIDAEILTVSKSNHPLLANILLSISMLHKKITHLFPPLSNLLARFNLLLIGGSVELFGLKTQEYERKIDRNVVPIDNSKTNHDLVKFYKETFIPVVYPVFSESHKRATSAKSDPS